MDKKLVARSGAEKKISPGAPKITGYNSATLRKKSKKQNKISTVDTVLLFAELYLYGPGHKNAAELS